MNRKSKDELKEMLDKSSFRVTKREHADARPTVPGEIVIADNFGGTAVSVNEGFVVNCGKKRLYYTAQEFTEKFEIVPGGFEGPGNTRECRYKGSFRAASYEGEPFIYRHPEGILSIVQPGMFVVEESDDFFVYTDKEFNNEFKTA